MSDAECSSNAYASLSGPNVVPGTVAPQAHPAPLIGLQRAAGNRGLVGALAARSTSGGGGPRELSRCGLAGCAARGVASQPRRAPTADDKTVELALAAVGRGRDPRRVHTVTVRPDHRRADDPLALFAPPPGAEAVSLSSPLIDDLQTQGSEPGGCRCGGDCGGTPSRSSHDLPAITDATHRQQVAPSFSDGVGQDGPSNDTAGAQIDANRRGSPLGDARRLESTNEQDRLLVARLARSAHRADGVRLLQRDFSACQSLLDDASAVNVLSGQAVHKLIETHFLTSVAGARKVTIPGASAAPQRSDGICGDDSTVSTPQTLGGKAGYGVPDLARATSGGILQVAEIKPAAAECLVDGEEQAMRYVDQGNARDPKQEAWRASQGVKLVSPMPPSAYKPPELSTAAAEIKTAWCTDGLMAYSVRQRAERKPIPEAIPDAKKEKDKDQGKRPTGGWPWPLGIPLPQRFPVPDAATPLMIPKSILDNMLKKPDYGA